MLRDLRKPRVVCLEQECPLLSSSSSSSSSSMGNQSSSCPSVQACGACFDTRYHCCDVLAPPALIKRCDSMVDALLTEDAAALAIIEQAVDSTISSNTDLPAAASGLSSSVQRKNSNCYHYNNNSAGPYYDTPLFGDVEDQSYQENHNYTFKLGKKQSFENNHVDALGLSSSTLSAAPSGNRHTRNLSTLSLSSAASDVDIVSRDGTEARSEHSIPVRNNSTGEREDVEDEITRIRAEQGEVRRRRQGSNGIHGVLGDS